MNIALIITLALLPVIVLIAYIYIKDKNKEPTKLLAKGLMYGVFAGIFAGIINDLNWALGQHLVGNIPIVSSLYHAFIVAGLDEECCKLFMLWLLLRNNEHFDEYMDGIVYAVCIGLGFAGMENIDYVFRAAMEPDGNWMAVGITRALLSVPGHYAFAVAMGFFYSLCHFNPELYGKWKPCILLVPIFFHGVYDSLCMISEEIPVLASTITAFLYAFVIWMHRICNRRLLALRQKDLDTTHLSLFREKMKSTESQKEN